MLPLELLLPMELLKPLGTKYAEVLRTVTTKVTPRTTRKLLGVKNGHTQNHKTAWYLGTSLQQHQRVCHISHSKISLSNSVSLEFFTSPCLLLIRKLSLTPIQLNRFSQTWILITLSIATLHDRSKRGNTRY